VSDVKIEQKQSLSRQEAARFIAELADGLGDDGKVTVRLGSSTLELSVADQLQCELEVAVDGDEIELELELKWSTAGRAAAQSTDDESAEEQSEEDDEAAEEAEPAEADSAPDVTAEGAPDGGESDGAGSGEAESEDTTSPKQSVEPVTRRRRASSKADKPAVNGVDTAAVRAWAAANGLTVPPRGRIKDEVIKAYRAAGN
jgi:amphi-Trp domain-containing protein